MTQRTDTRRRGGARPGTSPAPRDVARPASRSSLPATEPAAFLALLDAQDQPRQQIALQAGQRATIGRGDTCFIRVDDERCSREHCLIFQVSGQWMLKDLSSRNGTLVEGRPVNADFPLFDRTIFQIGDVRLQFFEQAPTRREGDPKATAPTLDLLDLTEPGLVDEDTAAQFLSSPGDSAVLPPRQESSRSRKASRASTPRETSKPPTQGYGTADIVELARRSRLSDPERPLDADEADAVAALLQAGSQVGQATSIRSASRLALEALLRLTSARFGAVLMLPSTRSADRDPEKLSMTGFESRSEQPYTRVSRSVSRLVFERDVGVLFRDTGVEDDLKNAGSVGELSLQSAVCVPIRLQDRIAGLIHLYSQDVDQPLGQRDFHLTLALADLLSGVFHQLWERKRAEDKANKEKTAADKLRAQLASAAVGEIVGTSPSIAALRKEIAQVAPTEATVLVRGESGVGKELVGRAMHYASSRANGPFVTMNCAALTESLLESELFGHEKGSFTGATAKKKGKFEQAHHGTLMLDEVGEMSLDIQAKFLRVLEGHAFERVGGSEAIETDVRVVAATNRDLEEAVREGRFREDLYFRLHVIVITIDPLRHRASDIPLLAQHFIERFAPRCGRDVRGLSQEATERLQSYRWPGNVRELQNTIERAVIMSRGELIEPGDVRFSTLSAFDEPEDVADENESSFREITIEDLEREHILKSLEATEWNKTRAAQILGIERSTLDRKLKRYGVSRPE